ncbi:hypothetical protein LXL04_011687 [Taraxacum kok-saghyz]
MCICAQSLYNTYLKSCTYAQKIKKSCTYAKVKKKYRFFGNVFQRIVMIKNVLEGSEVGFLKGITSSNINRGKLVYCSDHLLIRGKRSSTTTQRHHKEKDSHHNRPPKQPPKQPKHTTKPENSAPRQGQNRPENPTTCKAAPGKDHQANKTPIKAGAKRASYVHILRQGQNTPEGQNTRGRVSYQKIIWAR